MQVRQILNPGIDRLPPEAVVMEAAQLMRDHNVGIISIVEAERLVGVITDRDIVLRCVAASRDAHSTAVEEIMSLEVVCCFADDTVEHVRQLMKQHNVPRLPVVDRKHHLLGLVTLPDVDGGEQPRKAAVKVTFHKEKTDSYGRSHKVPVKTMYITGIGEEKSAADAAIRHVEEEAGTSWQTVASGMDTEQEPPVAGERSK